MEKKPWYEELFENFALSYDKEIYTQGTLQEVAFIEKEINFNKSFSILDIGCGTGRHAVELAKKGYNVTGIDLSEDQLKAATKKAKKAKVKIDFLKADARSFDLNKKFDLVIMLCEGGFSLMETDEENFAILQNGTNHIKSGGKFIFTTLSVLFPIFNNLKKFHDENVVNGGMDSHSFDLLTFRDHNIFDIPDDDGNPRRLDCNERYYAPSEIRWMMKSLGFSKIGIYGCKTGNFDKRELTVNDFEMLVIAEK